MPNDEERFFFVHLQKTAGTSLRMGLQHQFGEAAVYPDSSDGESVESAMSIEYLQDRYRARRHEIRVITGHFPLCTAEILGGGFTTLTILREPVERTLSYLSHHRAWSPDDSHKDLEEIYSDPLRFHGLIHNHMVKMFSLTPDEPALSALTRIEFMPQRLDRAKENLASIDAFGLQERFDEFCGELRQRFGWDLGSPKYANRAEAAEVSEQFRARIAEDNAMDIELYEFARELYESRGGEASPRRTRLSAG